MWNKEMVCASRASQSATTGDGQHGMTNEKTGNTTSTKIECGLKAFVHFKGTRETDANDSRTHDDAGQKSPKEQ